jgi:hypothetical protein
MRWLLLTRCVDADPEADLSPPPLIVEPRTLFVPLLPLLVPLLLLVLRRRSPQALLFPPKSFFVTLFNIFDILFKTSISEYSSKT